MTRLNPLRMVRKDPPFVHSWMYQKLDYWIKQKLYPHAKTYRGAFDVKLDKNFCRPTCEFEEIYDRIRKAKEAVITPSPVHMVWRVRTMISRPW